MITNTRYRKNVSLTNTCAFILIALLTLIGCSSNSSGFYFSDKNEIWHRKTDKQSVSGSSCHVELFGAIPLNKPATTEAALKNILSKSANEGRYAFKDMSWNLTESYYYFLVSSVECKNLTGRAAND
jgi:hypothetical protein